jgi:hypothetical protein
MTFGESSMEDDASLAERLERGELLHFPTNPFPLPEGDDRLFLQAQQLRGDSEPNISYDLAEGKLHGHRSTKAADAERLAALMRAFSNSATGWLANQLPEYLGKWVRDRATLRTEEEAIRPLRHSVRNDLLHIDNFPGRPSGGRRILRIYANINNSEDRVWVTSEKLDALIARFRAVHRIPVRSAEEWSEPFRGLQRLLHGDWSGRPAYDTFMLKLQQFLRFDEQFQERSPRRFWHFPPNSVWVLFADGLSHAVLRGQFALEHSYFVPQEAVVLPEFSPLGQLIEAGVGERLRKAG